MSVQPRNVHVSTGQTGGRELAEKEFSRVVLEAVDEGLLVLGASVRDTIYYNVERDDGIRRQEIPGRVEDFHKALERLFGSGVRTIEKLIAKSLCGRLGIALLASENWSLVDYVDYVKKAPRVMT